jgi:Metallo-peptidase family M12B Reprolysin-like
MASLRSAAECIGLSANFSILHDFFGHRSIPLGKSYSLRDQLQRLEGKHIHVNVILVGSDAFTSSHFRYVDVAIFDTRRIYSAVGLGVGRVLWFEIPVSMAAGHDEIDSDSEACALTNSWTVHNNGLDVFVVRNAWTDGGESHDGISDQGASCDKDASESFSGSVVSLHGSSSGIVMAHELGHDLGLHHIDDLDLDDVDEAAEVAELTVSQVSNLMFPAPKVSLAEKLNSEQVATIMEHCLIQPGC